MKTVSISLFKRTASIGIVVVLFFMANSCNENEFMNSGYLEIDDTRLKIDPEFLIINYNDLFYSSEGCQSKYFEIRITIKSGKNTLYYLNLTGPAMDNGFVPGEYPISSNCNGTLNFIETGKVVSEPSTCQLWNEFYQEYYTTTCSREISREEYYFQENDFLHEMNGEGALKILTLDQESKRLSFELDIDVYFAVGSISNQATTRKRVTARYNGSYIEDWLGPIIIPWQLRYQPPVDSCTNPSNPYDINPITQTLSLDVKPSGDVHVVGAIGMEDSRAAACYDNKVLFKKSTISVSAFDQSFHSDTTYITEPVEIDFGNLSANTFIVLNDLKSLIQGKEYIAVFKSIYDVKGFQEGVMLEFESSTISYFKIKDSPYTCLNSSIELISDCRWD